MVAIKQNKLKQNSKSSKTTKSENGLGNKPWTKVKLKGNVIDEGGVGFEGLIGLEVLEDYDPKLVKIGTEKQTRKQIRMQRKSLGKKRKTGDDGEDYITEGSSDNDSDNEDEDDGYGSRNSSKNLKNSKQNLTQRVQMKIEKRREKRERRKALKGKAAKGQAKPNDKSVDNENNIDDEEYPPERFALLRPPPATESDDEVPELVDVNKMNTAALDVDDLEGWNGLGVPQTILTALAEKGFKSPTQIQKMTLPAAILGKKDILGAAETGSGKTLAFGIPVLTGIMELKAKNLRTGIRKAPKQKADKTKPKEIEEELQITNDFELENLELEMDDDAKEEDDVNTNGPLYAVMLTPTRELAVQIRDHLVAAAKYTGINIAAIFGGLAVAKQERLLRKCPEIVVATPGRFWELYQQENPHLSKIDDISFLVIDETDRMVEKGHFEELRSLLKVLNANEKKKQSRQNFVFSATLTLVHDLPEHMQKHNMGKRPRYIKQTPGLKIQSLIEELGISQPKIVDITRSQQTAQSLTECRLICPIDHKDYYLYYFVERHPGRTIVFCNSIDCVKRLATIFGLLACNPLPLHASMVQKQRLKNLERFRDNPNGLLIATDVAARGLDIPNVDHVIHYQVPRTSENYVHRSGRTARATKDGLTVMFMEPGEVRNYVKLYKTLDRTEDLPLFPISEHYLTAVKERVNLAREVDKQELKLKRIQTEQGWMKKNADDMDIIIDGYNDESGSDQDEDPYIIERRRNRMQLTNARYELKSLLSKHIFPRGFSFKYPTLNANLHDNDMSTKNNEKMESNSAVKAVKDSIEELKLAKQMRNKKRKLHKN